MIWHIAKKDFLTNILTPKFLVGFLLCLLLIPYTVSTGVKSYEAGIVEYEKGFEEADKMFEKAQIYAWVRPILIVPPTPLGIFCTGLNNQVGHYLVIDRWQKPLFAEGVTGKSENPFMNGFLTLDFVNILVILLSLLGIFFSYDLLCRERENGTLKLALSNSVSRSTYFLGKIVGIYITVLPILVVCFIIQLLIIGFSPKVGLSSDDYFRLLILFLMSIIYFSFFVFLGAYISGKVKRPATSIIINLFVWCTLLFLIPNTVSYLGRNIVRIDDYGQLQNELNVLRNERAKKINEMREKVKNEGYEMKGYNYCGGGNVDGGYMICFTQKATMQYERRLKELAAPFVEDFTNRMWPLQEDYLNQLLKQQRMVKYLSCISPGEIFKHLSGLLCKTGINRQLHFMEQARRYHDEFFTYYKNKKIYASYKFFTPHDEAEIPETGRDAGIMSREWEKTSNRKSTFDFSSLGYLDTSDLPRFQYKELNVINGLEKEMILLGGILIACVLLFWFSYVCFIRYDVR